MLHSFVKAQLKINAVTKQFKQFIFPISTRVPEKYVLRDFSGTMDMSLSPGDPSFSQIYLRGTLV